MERSTFCERSEFTDGVSNDHGAITACIVPVDWNVAQCGPAGCDSSPPRFADAFVVEGRCRKGDVEYAKPMA